MEVEHRKAIFVPLRLCQRGELVGCSASSLAGFETTLTASTETFVLSASLSIHVRRSMSFASALTYLHSHYPVSCSSLVQSVGAELNRCGRLAATIRERFADAVVADQTGRADERAESLPRNAGQAQTFLLVPGTSIE